jgi:hypothetical protein
MEQKLTPEQIMWADVFRCAQLRSEICFKEKDIPRYIREHTTIILALQKGDSSREILYE